MALKATKPTRRGPRKQPNRVNTEKSSAQEDALLIATILAGKNSSAGASDDLLASRPADRPANNDENAEQACEALVRKYWKVLVGWVRPRVRCTRDAEEIAQDAFIKAFRSLSSLQSPRSFLAWLLRITANLTTDFIRSRRPHVSLDQLGDDGPAFEERSSAVGSLEQEEEVNRVLDAIARLPEKYHLVLALRYRAELSAKDIATLLDEPEGTIRNRVFRALEKAREILARRPENREP
jgi:RNA polymerase sigma-70 factor (ECF subfamily)